MRVTSDRIHHLDLPPTAVWQALVRTDAYRTWWPWLRRFDAEGLTPGACWRCAVQPPLPYRVDFEVVIDEVCVPELVTATVRGGLCGTARLELTGQSRDLAGAPGGSQTSVLALSASLIPANRILTTVAALSPGVARYGHDWVLDTGFRQFRERALGLAPPDRDLRRSGRGRAWPGARRNRRG